MWVIWKARNNFIFNHKPVDPLATLIVVNVQVREFVEQACKGLETGVSSRKAGLAIVRKQQPAVIWRPPMQGRIKLNTDASWLPNGSASGGVIGRNSKGDLEILHAVKFKAHSVIVAEALAMREALILAVNFGFSKVTFKSDSWDLIQACRSKQSVGEISGIIADIKELVHSLDECGFTWAGREANKVAHTIAKL